MRKITVILNEIKKEYSNDKELCDLIDFCLKKKSQSLLNVVIEEIKISEIIPENKKRAYLKELGANTEKFNITNSQVGIIGNGTRITGGINFSNGRGKKKMSIGTVELNW